MRIVLATLVLNEMQWLPQLYEQHKDWLGLVKWVFVEAADRMYAEVNPGRVSHFGLSVDGTTEFLRELEDRDHLVEYVPHGFSTDPNPAQGKCAARSRYLQCAESVEPDFIGVLDADEFYAKRDQSLVNATLAANPRPTGFVFRHREVWRPPSCAKLPLFSQEAIDGFWAIPYCRWWRWKPGLRYARNHNTPEDADGIGQDRALARYDRVPRAPQMVHLGFASSLASREAKHRYYQARGEGKEDKRGWYVSSRRAWERWRVGMPLPRGARVVPYSGPIPECFRVGVSS